MTEKELGNGPVGKMTKEEEYDFFNPPLTRPAPKEIKSKGYDVWYCKKCDAYTIYLKTCAVCGIKDDVQLIRFSGRYVRT